MKIRFRMPTRFCRYLFSAVLTLCFGILCGLPAQAAQYDLANLFANASFESGLSGWSYTGAGVNPTTYLTDAEWSGQT